MFELLLERVTNPNDAGEEILAGVKICINRGGDPPDTRTCYVTFGELDDPCYDFGPVMTLLLLLLHTHTNGSTGVDFDVVMDAKRAGKLPKWQEVT